MLILVQSVIYLTLTLPGEVYILEQILQHILKQVNLTNLWLICNKYYQKIFIPSAFHNLFTYIWLKPSDYFFYQIKSYLRNHIMIKLQRGKLITPITHSHIRHWKMATHTLKIFKVCLTIFQHYVWNSLWISICHFKWFSVSAILYDNGDFNGLFWETIARRKTQRSYF